MEQTPATVPSAEQRRIDHLEREVAQRLAQIDAGIEEAKEGQFVRIIIRREVEAVVEQEREEARRTEQQRIENIRRKRRRRIGFLLGGAIVLGGAAYAAKEYWRPDMSATEVLQEIYDKLSRSITEPVEEAGLADPSEKKTMIVTPEEEQWLLKRRQDEAKLRQLTQQLVEARIELERLKAESPNSPSVQQREEKVKELENSLQTHLSAMRSQHSND